MWNDMMYKSILLEHEFLCIDMELLNLHRYADDDHMILYCSSYIEDQFIQHFLCILNSPLLSPLLAPFHGESFKFIQILISSSQESCLPIDEQFCRKCEN